MTDAEVKKTEVWLKNVNKMVAIVNSNSEDCVAALNRVFKHAEDNSEFYHTDKERRSGTKKEDTAFFKDMAAATDKLRKTQEVVRGFKNTLL